MPSRGGELRGYPDHVFKQELWAVSLTGSLRSQIRLLTLRRRAAFELARAHRRDGQLVPASLGEEMVENGFQLRSALERYAEETAKATAGRTPA